MKRTFILCAGVIIGCLSTVAIVAAQSSPPKPEKGMIIGDVIEFSTYVMKGYGEEHIAAHKARAEEGFPVGILEEETGDVWIAVYRDAAPASHLETANEILTPLMGKKAVVQGLKYRSNGVNLIRISVASEY